MVLAQKQTHRSTEHNRKTQNYMVHLSSTKRERIPKGEKTVSSQMVLGKLDSYMQKNNTGPLSYGKHPHTQNSKWIEDLNVRRAIIKVHEESIGSNLCDIGR